MFTAYTKGQRPKELNTFLCAFTSVRRPSDSLSVKFFFSDVNFLIVQRGKTQVQGLFNFFVYVNKATEREESGSEMCAKFHMFQ